MSDQPSRPTILADGTVVLTFVDRFSTRSISAAAAPSMEKDFGASVTVYDHTAAMASSNSTRDATEANAAMRQHAAEPNSNLGETLSDQFLWTFGLPFTIAGAVAGEVLVVYYAGVDEEAMDLKLTRLQLAA